MGSIGCPETSVTENKNRITFPEEGRSHLGRGWSVTSSMFYLFQGLEINVLYARFVCRLEQPQRPSFYDPNNVCWKVRVMKLISVEFLQHPATCPPVEARIIHLGTLCSNRPPVYFPLIANGLLRKTVVSWNRMCCVVGNGHSKIISFMWRQFVVTHWIRQADNFLMTRQLGYKRAFYQHVISTEKIRN